MLDDVGVDGHPARAARDRLSRGIEDNDRGLDHRALRADHARRKAHGQRWLETRRELLERKVLPTLVEPVRYVDALDAELSVLIQSVREQSFEGLVAKRRDSRYEPGLRSGAWQKMRVNQGQECVIGGYTVGARTFDALIFGYYEGRQLIYAARTLTAAKMNACRWGETGVGEAVRVSRVDRGQPFAPCAVRRVA